MLPPLRCAPHSSRVPPRPASLKGAAACARSDCSEPAIGLTARGVAFFDLIRSQPAGDASQVRAATLRRRPVASSSVIRSKGRAAAARTPRSSRVAEQWSIGIVAHFTGICARSTPKTLWPDEPPLLVTNSKTRDSRAKLAAYCRGSLDGIRGRCDGADNPVCHSRLRAGGSGADPVSRAPSPHSAKSNCRLFGPTATRRSDHHAVLFWQTSQSSAQRSNLGKREKSAGEQAAKIGKTYSDARLFFGSRCGLCGSAFQGLGA